MKFDENRRKQLRTEFLAFGKIFIGIEAFDVNVIDINLKGIQLITFTRLEQDQDVMIDINLDDNIVLNAKCKVAWIKENKPSFNAGLRFYDIDESEIIKIFRKAGLPIPVTPDSPPERLRNARIVFNKIFDNYEDELFFKHLDEFVDYITTAFPENTDWALKKVNSIKDKIEEVKYDILNWME